MNKRKPRKPKDLAGVAYTPKAPPWDAMVLENYLCAADCRRLAAWLIRYIEWAEAKEGA